MAMESRARRRASGQSAVVFDRPLASTQLGGPGLQGSQPVSVCEVSSHKLNVPGLRRAGRPAPLSKGETDDREFANAATLYWTGRAQALPGCRRGNARPPTYLWPTARRTVPPAIPAQRRVISMNVTFEFRNKNHG